MQTLAVHAAALLAALTGLVLTALLLTGPALAALMLLAGLILVLLLLITLRAVLLLLVPLWGLFIRHLDVLQSLGVLDCGLAHRTTSNSGSGSGFRCSNFTQRIGISGKNCPQRGK
jgi:hypothetical protein